MKHRFTSIHIVALLFLMVLQLTAIFSTDNPLILLSSFTALATSFLITGNARYIKRGMLYFIPFAFISVTINFMFVSQGSIILFNAFDRSFTLEALIYAFIFAGKLLMVIYIFDLFVIMVDSDRAVSYFSGILPKSTLMLMISFKLFPSLKNRLASIKEVYSIRGVDYQKKSLKDKLKSYLPVLSILLETSMEGAFDIGEAAYVRGFLSTRRTVYDRQKLNRYDYLLIFHSGVFGICFFLIKLYGQDAFDIYYNIKTAVLINYGIASLSILELLFPVVIYFISVKRE